MRSTARREAEVRVVAEFERWARSRGIVGRMATDHEADLFLFQHLRNDSDLLNFETDGADKGQWVKYWITKRPVN
jgi:hypothetical protein